MRDRSTTKPSLALAWAIGLLEWIVLATATVLLLSSPLAFRCLYPRVHPAGQPQTALQIVQWLATAEPVESLNLRVKGQLTSKELNHYRDVRRCLGQVTSLLSFAAAALVLLIGIARPCTNALRSAQWRGLLAVGVILGSAGLLAVWDWKTFFAWFHYPLFGATSWRFPKQSLSLALFPTFFWKWMGALALLSPALVMAGIGWGLKDGTNSKPEIRTRKPEIRNPKQTPKAEIPN